MKNILSLVLLFGYCISNANNVQLSNISVTSNITNTGKVIQFDISWENSWRTSSTGNYDGVWVFFKFKDNDGKWKHLNFTTTNVTLPGSISYSFGNNGANTGVGLFLYRSSNGTGTVTITNAKAGITAVPGTFDIKGFALEMVYIPQGSFYLGDSTSSTYTYKKNPGIGPYLVTGGGASVTIGSAAGNLSGTFSGYQGTLQGYPTGYAAFWCMKYELSRGGLRDFFNCLTYEQQANIFLSSRPPSAATGTSILTTGVLNNDLKIVTPGVQATNTSAVIGCDYDNDNIFNESTDGEWKVANSINWAIMASYLDWAGLRPMSEFEFEKICRGPLYPVPHEYPWGNTNLDTTAYTIINDGMINETVSNSSGIDGNAAYNVTMFNYNARTLRQGIFANAFSNRTSSGAAYYGVMEMGGSVVELCVTTHNAAGRSYTGKHGDGILSTHGYSNENYWPGINGVGDTSLATTVYDGGIGVRNIAGLIERGSHNSGPDLYLEISSRIGAFILYGPGNISNTSSTYYQSKYGIRGVRDAN